MCVAEMVPEVVQMAPVAAKAAAAAARKAPARRSKPILRHPAELRTLGFTSLFYGCLITLWCFDTELWAAGPLGWLAYAALYGTMMMFAAVMVRPPTVAHCSPLNSPCSACLFGLP